VDGDFLSPFGPSESSSRRTGGREQADTSLAAGVDFSAGIESFSERAGSTYITGAAFQPSPVTRRVTGYFAEGRWNTRQRLFVTGGVRVDDIRRDALEANAGVARPSLPAESTLSANPRLSVAWFARPDAGTHTRIRAAAGTGIRPPDGFEIAFSDNPALEPERSVSAEAGIEQALASGRVLLEATAFANRYDDLIIAVGSFTEASRYRTDNISNARARGVELSASARGRIGERGVDLEARAAYTFLDTEILAVDGTGSAPPPFTVGDALLRRPRHQIAVDLSLRGGPFGAYLRGGGRGRVLDVEPSLGTFAGQFFEASGYAVWHAGASWRLGRALEVFARVENLFDREYEEAFGYPAPRRGAFIGLRVAAGR
jgi:outer membrane receptor protein involved in Fe transport